MLADANSSWAPSRNGVESRVLQPGGERERLAGDVRALDQQRELVSADPGDDLVGPERLGQPIRECDEQAVADGWCRGCR